MVAVIQKERDNSQSSPKDFFQARPQEMERPMKLHVSVDTCSFLLAFTLESERPAETFGVIATVPKT